MNMESPDKNNDRPVVYGYLDYRQYLRDMYSYFKNQTKGGFSHRVFSKRAELGSPNYLKMVMDGQRDLSFKTVQKFAKALKMNRDEIGFFEALVFYCKSKTNEQKDFYFKRLKRYKKFSLVRNISVEEHAYFSHWYIPAVREMVLMKGFKEDPAWIAKKLNPAISASEAKKAIEVLEHLKLVERDEKGGLSQSKTLIFSGDGLDSSHLWNFHREMITKAYQALRLPVDQRHISGVTLAISFEKYGQLQELVHQFYSQVEEITKEDTQKSDVVCQINIQQFPLTQFPQKGP